MAKAILINTEFCTGCHSCEIACRNELDLAEGDFGIKLTEVGPHQFTSGEKAGQWEWLWSPVLTKQCDGCADRVANGKMVMCVQHCQAWCMYYGEAEDLVKKMDGTTRWSLQTIPENARY